MGRLRVGMIGLGRVSEVHLAAYRDADLVEVVAGAEVRADRLAQMAQQWGITGYTDPVEMLKKEKLDIAVICTTPATHRQVTEQAAAYGVHVLCEKPMALSIADTQAMIDACAKAGVLFYYGSSYRQLTAVRKAREVVQSGVLGDIQLMLEVFMGGHGLDKWQPLSEHHYPTGGPGGGGMGLIDHGIHLVDIFPWLCGATPEWVFGRGNLTGGPAGAEYLTMGMNNGAIGQLVYTDTSFSSEMPYEGIFSWGLNYGPAGELSGPSWVDEPGCFRIHGTKGALRVFHYAQKVFLFQDGRQEEIRVADRPHPGNFGLQIESLARSIFTKEPAETSGLDGLKALRVILGAYESAKTRTVVALPPLS